MNTKQTPEQSAEDVLYSYSNGSVYDIEAARQTIIKAFQDRERLLDALEQAHATLVGYMHQNQVITAAMKSSFAAIAKAKEV